MASLWFWIVAAMIATYVVLDGFDLGAGAIYLIAAKTNDERRRVLRAIGPVWDGNEVWLLAAGGTLYFAFPRLYASSFSGFYLPLTIVLWLLILRGIGIEFRAHIENRVWQDFFDAILSISSTLLARAVFSDLQYFGRDLFHPARNHGELREAQGRDTGSDSRCRQPRSHALGQSQGQRETRVHCLQPVYRQHAGGRGVCALSRGAACSRPPVRSHHLQHRLRHSRIERRIGLVDIRRRARGGIFCVRLPHVSRQGAGGRRALLSNQHSAFRKT